MKVGIAAICLALLFSPFLALLCACDSSYYSADEVIAMAKTRYQYTLPGQKQMTNPEPKEWQAEYQGDGKWEVSYRIERWGLSYKEAYNQYLDMLRGRKRILTGEDLTKQETDDIFLYVVTTEGRIKQILSTDEFEAAFKGVSGDEREQAIQELVRQKSPTIGPELVKVIISGIISDEYPRRYYFNYYEKANIFEYDHSQREGTVHIPPAPHSSEAEINKAIRPVVAGF